MHDWLNTALIVKPIIIHMVFDCLIIQGLHRTGKFGKTWTNKVVMKSQGPFF